MKNNLIFPVKLHSNKVAFNEILQYQNYKDSLIAITAIFQGKNGH